MDRNSDIGRELSRLVGSELVLATALGGGDVAACYRVQLADGRTVFAKTYADPPRHFFDTEARGLTWLRESNTLAVPEVLGVSDLPPLLVLAWIDEAARPSRSDAAFGRGLADLHRTGAPAFGRQDRRTTGSRALPNEPCDTWAEFYATQRLLPLTRLARDTGTYSSTEADVFEAVAARLDQFEGAAEPPARLHGDLWAGNRLVDASGESWVIDPACHGGHREFDLAMMRLFGGFGNDAFEAYHEAHPLADGHAERVKLHQLAPLTVHAIKFGGGYVGAALEAAKSYC